MLIKLYLQDMKFELAYPEARVSVEKVDGSHDDVESNDDVIDVGNEEFSVVGSVGKWRF